MKPPEFHEGPEARKRFEEGMKKLFNTPKSGSVPKPAPKKRKKVKPSKDVASP
jgi:hypothetical protein